MASLRSFHRFLLISISSALFVSRSFSQSEDSCRKTSAEMTYYLSLVKLQEESAALYNILKSKYECRMKTELNYIVWAQNGEIFWPPCNKSKALSGSEKDKLNALYQNMDSLVVMTSWDIAFIYLVIDKCHDIVDKISATTSWTVLCSLNFGLDMNIFV